MVCGWNRDPNWFFKGTVEFNDPIQGKAGNCSFLAGLSSAVWVNAGFIQGVSSSWTDPAGNACKMYQITFYRTTGGTQPVFVTDYFKWNGDFCWAKSKTPNEIWVGIYEKAYAAFLLGTYGTSSDPIHQPVGWADSGEYINGSTKWPQFALTPLKNLTGMMTEGPSGPAPTSAMESMEIFNDLYSRALPQLYCKPTPPYAQYRLRRPVVAWTGINVTSPCITTEHTYSVLGLVKYTNDASDDQENYLVLRNPLGSCPSVPPNNSGNNFCGILLNGTNGVFAISAREFKANFSAYGWVL
jgi:hypothetical protein